MVAGVEHAYRLELTGESIRKKRRREPVGPEPRSRCMPNTGGTVKRSLGVADTQCSIFFSLEVLTLFPS
jgi:hypothetical protein